MTTLSNSSQPEYGSRSPRRRTKVFWSAGVALLLATAGIGWYSLRHGSGAQNASSHHALAASIGSLSADEKQAAYKDAVSTLQDRVVRLQSYLDGFPKEFTDVKALASTLATAQAAFEYLRDQVAMEPYPGVMKGAGGTLITRGGNSLDRALLLAALLKQNGIAAQIAYGKLTPDQAQSILQGIITAPGAIERILEPLPNSPTISNLTDFQQQAAKAREQQGEQAGSAVRDAVDKNLPLIESALKQTDLPGDAAAVQQRLEILQDHYWVQATVEGRIVDLDPSLRNNSLNQKLTDRLETFDPDNLSDSLFQHVRFQLIGEFLDNGRLQSRELLSKEVRATDLLGKNVRFALGPYAPSANEGRFQALLLIGNDRTEGQEFRLSGSSAGGAAGQPAEGPSGIDSVAPGASQAGGLGAGAGGGGVFDELNGSTQPPAPKPAPKPKATTSGPVLARLSMQVTSTSPHLADAHYQRVILDRLDASGSQIQPDLADDTVVRALLMQAWDGAASVGLNNPLRVLAVRLDALKALEPMQEKAVARLYLGSDFGVNDLPGPMLPPELTDYFFASDIARFLLVRQLAPGTRCYYERPRLAFFRHGFVVGDWSHPQGNHRFAEGIDLLNTPFQFLAAAGANRMGPESGIVDTALERLTVGADHSFNTIPLFAAATAAGIPILTISPDQKSALSGITIPSAIRNVLVGELAQGRTIIVPGQLVPFDNIRTYGWWSVDPANGMMLGKMELGGAQALTETIEMHERIEKWTEIFAKFYGNLWKCYGIALAENLGGLEILKTRHLKQGASAPDADTLATCVIKAACEAIGDLLAEAVSSTAFAREASGEIESLKKIIFFWSAEKFSKFGYEKGYEKICEGAAGVKD